MRIRINPHRHAADDIHPVLCKCPRQFPRNLASIGTSCPRPDNCHTLSSFFWQPANIIQRIRCCRNPAELLRVPRIFHADKTDSFPLQFSPVLLYIPVPSGLCDFFHILFIQNPDFFHLGLLQGIQFFRTDPFCHKPRQFMYGQSGICKPVRIHAHSSIPPQNLSPILR